MTQHHHVIVSLLLAVSYIQLSAAHAGQFRCPQLASRDLTVRLASPWEAERLAAQRELEELGPWAVGILLSEARAGSFPLSGSLLTYLARQGGTDGVAYVSAILRDDTAQVENRARAAVALGRARAEGAVFELMRSLSRGPAILRAASAESLGTIGDPRARMVLQRALRDEDDGVMAAAAVALARLGDSQGVHRLVSRYKAGSSTTPGSLAVRSSLLQIIDMWPEYRGIRQAPGQRQNHLLARWISEYERGTLPPAVSRPRSDPTTEAHHRDE